MTCRTLVINDICNVEKMMLEICSFTEELRNVNKQEITLVMHVSNNERLVTCERDEWLFISGYILVDVFFNLLVVSINCIYFPMTSQHISTCNTDDFFVYTLIPLINKGCSFSVHKLKVNH